MIYFKNHKKNSSIFKGLCLNCLGNIDISLLENGLSFEKCLPGEDLNLDNLKDRKTERSIKNKYKVEKWINHFENFIKIKP